MVQQAINQLFGQFAKSVGIVKGVKAASRLPEEQQKQAQPSAAPKKPYIPPLAFFDGNAAMAARGKAQAKQLEDFRNLRDSLGRFRSLTPQEAALKEKLKGGKNNG